VVKQKLQGMKYFYMVRSREIVERNL